MESYLRAVPKRVIPKNTNKHEWVRRVYGTSRSIEEMQGGKFFEVCNNFVKFLGVEICSGISKGGKVQNLKIF